MPCGSWCSRSRQEGSKWCHFRYGLPQPGTGHPKPISCRSCRRTASGGVLSITQLVFPDHVLLVVGAHLAGLRALELIARQRRGIERPLVAECDRRGMEIATALASEEDCHQAPPGCGR